MSNKKIYCIDCKHILGNDECKHPNNVIYKDTPLRRVPVFKNINMYNSDNNCPAFEQREICEQPVPPRDRKIRKDGNIFQQIKRKIPKWI